MSEAKYPPNPLPCGCGVKGIDVSDLTSDRVTFGQLHVVHCPLHAAAGDLLAACETAAMACEVYQGQSPLIDEALAHLVAAVRKAERKQP